MLYIISILLLIQYLCIFDQCHGHGYLADPPARSSAWLFDRDFTACCQYYNHVEMFCGGTNTQWIVNGGKCSICGEAYDTKPHLFGLGDAMYLGKIVRTYIQGSVIPVKVVLTANHMGVFEFRVCNIDNNSKEDATQNCLDLNVLKLSNGSTQYHIESTFSTVIINVTLPANLTCKHCVFQWKYITGNSWGDTNGRSCVGCGKENEEFYGCSDISILNEVESIIDPIVTSTTVSEIHRNCASAVVFSRLFDLTALIGQYCQTICSNNCASEKGHNTMIYDGCRKSCDKLCICQ